MCRSYRSTGTADGLATADSTSSTQNRPSMLALWSAACANCMQVPRRMDPGATGRHHVVETLALQLQLNWYCGFIHRARVTAHGAHVFMSVPHVCKFAPQLQCIWPADSRNLNSSLRFAFRSKHAYATQLCTDKMGTAQARRSSRD